MTAVDVDEGDLPIAMRALLAIARVEGKLDAYASHSTARELATEQRLNDHGDRLDDHDVRLRTAAPLSEVDELWNVVRGEQNRHYITFPQLLAAVVGIVTVLGGVVVLLDRLNVTN